MCAGLIPVKRDEALFADGAGGCVSPTGKRPDHTQDIHGLLFLPPICTIIVYKMYNIVLGNTIS